MGELPEQDRPVTQGTFELKLKVLEQRLTIKLIAGLIGVQALAHFSLPSSVTVPAAAALLVKAFVALR